MRAAISLSIIIMLGLFGGCSGDNKLPGGSGFIEATETVVSAEVTGRVTALHVREGDRVQKGEPICEIYYRDHAELQRAHDILEKAISISDEAIEPPTLIKSIIE